MPTDRSIRLACELYDKLRESPRPLSAIDETALLLDREIRRAREGQHRASVEYLVIELAVALGVGGVGLPDRVVKQVLDAPPPEIEGR